MLSRFKICIILFLDKLRRGAYCVASWVTCLVLIIQRLQIVAAKMAIAIYFGRKLLKQNPVSGLLIFDGDVV